MSRYIFSNVLTSCFNFRRRHLTLSALLNSYECGVQL
jgi:hypothetical protein